MFAAVRPAVLLVAIAFVIACPCARSAETPQGSEVAVATDASPSAPELVAWIERLDHMRFAERQKASDALAAVGAPVVPYLSKTLRSGSLEASDRAVGILEEFSRSADWPLQIAALEALAQADRFPAARRGATDQLALICKTRLESLGAEFRVSPYRRTLVGVSTVVVINIDPKKWKGTPKDLELLSSLQRVESLQITAPMIDDTVVKQLAGIESLKQLTLIHTAASVDVVRHVKKEHPELRIILRGRASLGISLGIGGGLTISGFDPADGPAANSGLKKGDIIQAFNDKPVEDFDALTAQIAQHAPGESVELSVLRGEEKRKFTTELNSRDWANSPY